MMRHPSHSGQGCERTAGPHIPSLQVHFRALPWRTAIKGAEGREAALETEMTWTKVAELRT